ncbi:MAG TPA: ketoacyl-ACP synthase III [Mucilaginibacter sp.]|jgi:3-oxoacyl-[acyl-carrier-protein] synthase-3
MAFLSIPQVALKGISACVPGIIEENLDIANIDPFAVEKLIKTTGIERRRVAGAEVCTSDLCYEAAKSLLEKLKWEKDEIDALIFVSQSPDYILPATSPILQDRLGLSTNCLTIDISSGCSGFIYGLSLLGSYMQSGMIKKGLLLAGDTSSKMCSKEDKSTYPLFGDAGTATALAYTEDEEGFKFHLGSDGSGNQSINIRDGGCRHPFSPGSLDAKTVEEGITRNALQLSLDGMDVFSFGISKAPESVNELLSRFDLQKDEIDFFYFHQANMMMNERIRKKLQLLENKVPYSLKDFGNTSSASIPLTMVTQTGNTLKNGRHKIMACGFGVGLSWGSVYCETQNLVIPDLIKL